MMTREQMQFTMILAWFRHYGITFHIVKDTTDA